MNIPLNNDLAKTAVTATAAQLAAARQHFEDRWVLWNNIRLVLNVASLVCLTVGLALPARPPSG